MVLYNACFDISFGVVFTYVIADYFYKDRLRYLSYHLLGKGYSFGYSYAFFIILTVRDFSSFQFDFVLK